MKKLILVVAAFVAVLFVPGFAHATSASPSIISTTTASNVGAWIAAPSTGKYTELLGCVFSNGYSAGECATLTSSVSGEPAITMCAPSTTTLTMGSGLMSSNSRPTSPFAAVFGQRLLFSGSLTVSGSAAQATVTLVCSYRTVGLLGQ